MIWLWAIASILSFYTTPGWAVSPAKLRLDTPTTSVWVGEEQRLQVNLVDVDNQPVIAPRDWTITLILTAPSSVARREKVVIPHGAPSQSFTLTPDKTGVWEVVAQDSQLLDGAVVLDVRAKTRDSGGLDIISDILSSQSNTGPQIELRASPRRKLLADGKDSATIYGLLTGRQTPAAQDIHLRLHSDEGSLSPDTVLIPQGQFSGTAQLTSQHPGTVNIEYVGASPTASIVGKPNLQVAFGPPITRIALSVSPPRISFLESADLVARLEDEAGRPIATDDPRSVFLTIEGGGGQLEPTTLNFVRGSAEQRARLRPTRAGQVTIAAASPDLLTVRAQALVMWPMMAMLTSAFGGAIGGGLAFLQQRRTGMWRIVIGLVTGFILYWAAVFIGLKLIPVAVALNPVSALAISIIGGWLGTKVFGPLLQRLGVSAERE